MRSGKKMPRVHFLTNELENEFGEGEDTRARHQHFTWHEKYLSVNVHQTIHDVLNFSQLFWCLIRLGDESWMITYLIILIYLIILHTYIPNELTQLGSQCEYDLTPWQHFSSTYRVVLCRIFSLNCFFTNLPNALNFFSKSKLPSQRRSKIDIKVTIQNNSEYIKIG